MTLLSTPFESLDVDSSALNSAKIQLLIKELDAWVLVTGSSIQKLRRKFVTKNYSQSLMLTNRIAELAESVNHHPVITLEYGSVTVVWWTHELNGLHLNDFRMAACTSQLFESLAV